MKLIIFIILLLLVGILRIRYKVRHFEDHITDEEKEEYAKFLAQEEQTRMSSQEILQKLVVYRTLKERIHDDMSLEEMVDAFAEVQKISVGEPDNLLFEAGTYSFSGERMFHFSLVRQFQFMDEDEYVQLCLNIMYVPSIKTKFLFCTRWDTMTHGDFFTMVKSSRIFKVAQKMTPAKVTIRIEET
jgi:hypothetical protein